MLTAVARGAAPDRGTPGGPAWLLAIPVPAWIEDTATEQIRWMNEAAVSWLGGTAPTAPRRRGRATPLPDGATLVVAEDPIAELRAEVACLRAETVRLRAALAASSIRDPATGLWNVLETRRLVRLEIDRCRRHHRVFTLLAVRLAETAALDLAVGVDGRDQLVRRLARVCATGRRSVDVVGHLDGETVLLMLPETPTTSGELVAERVRRAAEADTPLMERPDGQSVVVSPRVDTRVITFPADGDDLDALLRAALRRQGDRWG